jgi:DNA topoisomerase-3
MSDSVNSRASGDLPVDNAPPPHSDEDYFAPVPELEQAGETDNSLLKNPRPNTIGRGHAEVSEKGKSNAAAVSATLEGILRDVFHFKSFRPYQQVVCESVTRGRDLLLVMPTGSGKSLCYQLPGIARGGTTLVVSPLIALMEDQAAGLRDWGFAAERIHSGRPHLQSRDVCKAYLEGRLDFLFVAPERLAVPGFPEMLSRRKPALVAIDEAHCISHWGHDFRPDYRLLGERLPIFRPAPVIAMTATATPRVQKDIIRQLGMTGPEMHIHGFRRDNIAIELMELLPSERTRKVSEILQEKKARPAIIYAPTRQKTEDLADALGNAFPAAPYHAGMSPETRDRVQTSFLSGEIDAIVATIAFGMGIDKPDIRTVIHTALPGSLEAYYQEIGRAGRDGKPSRAVLLHSYGDRRVHEFFHEKSYPPEDILKRIHDRLTEHSTPLDVLRNDLPMEQKEFEIALEKLRVHGGAVAGPDGTVLRGHDKWQITYKIQREHRRSQIDEVSRFAGSFSCRMLYLVRHFGDREDHGRRCGLCDFCAPDRCVASLSRQPDGLEKKVIREVISSLKRVDSLGTGRLYGDACPGSVLSRSHFENLLRSLVNAGLILLSEHSFEKGGKRIHYKRAELTTEGRDSGPEAIESLTIASMRAGNSTKGKAPAVGKETNRRKGIPRTGKSGTENPALRDTLREWRRDTARQSGLPAFRIFTNRVLDNLVSDLPTSSDALHRVWGVGPFFVERYGKEIIRMVKDYSKQDV